MIKLLMIELFIKKLKISTRSPKECPENNTANEFDTTDECKSRAEDSNDLSESQPCSIALFFIPVRRADIDV